MELKKDVQCSFTFPGRWGNAPLWALCGLCLNTHFCTLKDSRWHSEPTRVNWRFVTEVKRGRITWKLQFPPVYWAFVLCKAGKDQTFLWKDCILLRDNKRELLTSLAASCVPGTKECIFFSLQMKNRNTLLSLAGCKWKTKISELPLC